MITVTLVRIRIEWLLFDLALFLALLILSRLPFRSFFRNLVGWGVLLFVLFLFQALFTPGTRFTRFPWIPISREGLSSRRLNVLPIGASTLLCNPFHGHDPAP